MEILKVRQEKRHQADLKTLQVESQKRELKDKKMKETRSKHQSQLNEYKTKLLVKIDLSQKEMI